MQGLEGRVYFRWSFMADAIRFIPLETLLAGLPWRDCDGGGVPNRADEEGPAVNESRSC